VTDARSHAPSGVDTSTRSKSPRHEQPFFHLKLSEITCSLGQMVELAVTCTTLPEPTVVWSHNGLPVDVNDPRYVLKHDKGRYHCMIQTMTAHDEGEWRAFGQSAFGQCHSQCRLAMHVPDGFHAPDITKHLHDQRLVEGEVLKLEAGIDCMPPPDVSWWVVALCQYSPTGTRAP